MPLSDNAKPSSPGDIGDGDMANIDMANIDIANIDTTDVDTADVNSTNVDTANVDTTDIADIAIDIAIVGAGLSGLVCTQRLHRAGYRAVVLEKSRGLGGRMATRRLPDTCADHGLRWLEAQGPQSQQLIQAMLGRGLEPWAGTVYRWQPDEFIPLPATPRYVAADGITAVAKQLGAGLEIWRGQRVVAISSASKGWALTLESLAGDRQALSAKALVMAIPAPQALDLLQPLGSVLEVDLLEALAAVQFNPCITAIACFSEAERALFEALPWAAVQCPPEAPVAWISQESSKGRNPDCPALVVQSSAAFAAAHLDETDLTSAGTALLDYAKMHLLSGLPAPQILPQVLQVHRWRYATVRSPYSQTYLSASQPAPLVLAGDWCSSDETPNPGTEQALESGIAAADAINALLDSRPLPGVDYSAPSSAPVPLRF